MNKKIFFDVLFWVLFCASVVTTCVFSMDKLLYAAPILVLSIVLYFFAKKDIKDKIIPFKWWYAAVAPCLAGVIIALFTPAYCMIAVLIGAGMGILALLLGYFRVMNGADAIGIFFISFAAMPLYIFSFIPLSVVLIVISYVIGLIMYIAVPKWRKGIRFLVPMALSCALFGLFI